MADKTFKELWWERMTAKYGSEEAVRTALKEAGKLGKGIPRKSGFYKNPELAAKMGKLGGTNRWKNRG